jgi:hypothetical protein
MVSDISSEKRKSKRRKCEESRKFEAVRVSPQSFKMPDTVSSARVIQPE